MVSRPDTTYRVRVRSSRPADLRIDVELLSDEIRSPSPRTAGSRGQSELQVSRHTPCASAVLDA